MRNIDNAHSPKKQASTIKKHAVSHGKAITVKVATQTLKTSRVTRETKSGSRSLPRPSHGAAAHPTTTGPRAAGALNGVALVITGFAGLYSCDAYAKENNISRQEAMLTAQWTEVLAVVMSTPSETMKPFAGWRRDPYNGMLLPIGKLSGSDEAYFRDHFMHQIYLYDTESGVVNTGGVNENW